MSNDLINNKQTIGKWNTKNKIEKKYKYTTQDTNDMNDEHKNLVVYLQILTTWTTTITERHEPTKTKQKIGKK